MALIRKSDIDEVRSRVNLGDVVGEYVTLKSAGVGSLKGLCPFHDERNPSFHVRPQVGFYHCFGCGEGGDVYTFLQRMDQVTFAEAGERMAQRIGYQLHYEDGQAATDQGNRSVSSARTRPRRSSSSSSSDPRRRRAAAPSSGSAASTRARRSASASASPRRAGTRCPRTSRPRATRRPSS